MAKSDIGCDLRWHRDGAAWVLMHKRRRMGRVVPDDKHRGMSRVVLSRGRPSDIGGLRLLALTVPPRPKNAPATIRL